MVVPGVGVMLKVIIAQLMVVALTAGGVTPG
jgi:hypothetical protein